MNNQWNFYYFGYSRTLRKAYSAIQFRDVLGEVAFDNTNHYLVNKQYLWLGDDSWHESWHGDIAYVKLNFGPGAYKENNFADSTDKFGFAMGLKKYLPSDKSDVQSK